MEVDRVVAEIEIYTWMRMRMGGNPMDASSTATGLARLETGWWMVDGGLWQMNACVTKWVVGPLLLMVQRGLGCDREWEILRWLGEMRWPVRRSVEVDVVAGAIIRLGLGD
jgi:hypothetical protein